MSSLPDDLLLEKLRPLALHAGWVDAHSGSCHLEVRVAIDVLVQAAESVRDAGLYPVFMTAVHAQAHVELCYQFAVWDRALRVMLSTVAGPNGRAPSLTPLFPGLQWHEREAHDMFGIVFDNHPDLRPLLLSDEDRDLHPLRKHPDRLKPLESLRRTVPDAGGRDHDDRCG